MNDHPVDWQTIARHISQANGSHFQMDTLYNIVGGTTNTAYRLEGGNQNYFVKINCHPHFEFFAAEAAGLAELGQPAVIKVPLPLCWGTTEQHAYLVMEYITLKTDITTSASILLGQQLAVMHQVSKVPFGWYRNNYLGLTLQKNNLEENWVEFWRHQRLGYQLQLASRNGYSSLQTIGERLLADLHGFFGHYQPHSSLLHGDLWSGNYAQDMQGQPVIFDPAVYYGDRETDLAMTELFGGFPRSFYEAYQERWPLDPGYSIRKNLYKLYHVLNHLNLFGGNYLKQAEKMIASLLSEL